jgi:hypothetical protein
MLKNVQLYSLGIIAMPLTPAKMNILRARYNKTLVGYIDDMNSMIMTHLGDDASYQIVRYTQTIVNEQVNGSLATFKADIGQIS